MTRRIFVRSSDADNRLGGQLEPRGEIDLRLVPERLACSRDVAPRVADVAGARRLEPLLHRLAEDEADRLRDMVDGRRRARGDVEDAPVRAGRVGRADGGVDDVRDVREVPRLLAVPVDRDRLALVDG